MNKRDDELAKLIYGTQATYQEMQFAALIRADEREACAKVCEKQEDYGPLCDTPEDCAEAIRARGNT